MRRVLAALVLVAGCDSLWGLDRIDPARVPMDAPRPIDADPHAHTGPFMHFTMDMLDGTTVIDTVAGAVATCGGECPLEVAGHLGGGLDFNSAGQADERLEIASTPDFHIVDQFSVAGWIRLKALQFEGCPWNKPYSTGLADSWQLCIDQAATVSFITYGIGGSNQISTAQGWASIDDLFHHVAIVFDGSTKIIYWDGEVAVEGPGSEPLIDDDNVLIANDNDSGSYIAPVNGVIDDVSFFSYALTPAEVANLAAQ